MNSKFIEVRNVWTEKLSLINVNHIQEVKLTANLSAARTVLVLQDGSQFDTPHSYTDIRKLLQGLLLT